jgi:hypothetical protein
MQRWRWIFFVAVSAMMLIGGATIYRANRAVILAAACEAGLPNLSRPSRVPPDAIGCIVLGQKETLSGTVFASEHGSSLSVTGHSTPISLWMGQVFPSLKGNLDQSVSKYCINGATATLTGWRTQSGGPFGHMGYAKEQFFVDAVQSVGPLGSSTIAQAGPDPNWCHKD